MKLARPETFHPRIVLAGCPDGDDGVVAALRARGLHAHWLGWGDPEIRHADLVILRSGADHDRVDGSLAWTRRVPNLLNNADVIAWNTDQHYLRDLDWAGVPTLPSRRGPSVHPGATALVFLAGAQSHAFSAETEVDDPDFELWEVGRAALQAAARRLRMPAADLLYARADVVGGPGEVRLVSLDLVAPSLGWHLLSDYTRDIAQREFALAVESALDRFGLGPFSQRRP